MKTIFDAQSSLLKKWTRSMLMLCLSTCAMTSVQAGEKIEADPENGRYFSFEEVQGKGDFEGQMVGRVEFTDVSGAVTHIEEYAGGLVVYPESKVSHYTESERAISYMLALPFDLDFKGGSLEELLLAAQKGYTRSLDQSPEALRAHTLVGKTVFKPYKTVFKPYYYGSELNLRFPSISARCIKLNDFSNMLRVLTPSIRCDAHASHWSAPGSDQITGILFFVRTEGKTQTAVFNMADVRLASDARAQETLVAAMEAAWQAGAKRAIAAKVSYHAPTNLLMVNGLPNELEEARQVFRALQAKDSGEQAELQELKASILNLQKEISKLHKNK